MPRNPNLFKPRQKQALLLSLLVLLGCFGFAACSGGNFKNLETLPVSAYLDKPGDFLGNTYLLNAQIHSQIEWETGVGRILAVKTDGSNSRIPVFVPEVDGQNLHVGQRYEMRVGIQKGGLIYVEDLRKF